MNAMDKIKVLVLDVVSEERNKVAQMLLNVEYITVIGEVESSTEAVELIENNNIDVVLVGSAVEDDGYAVSEKLSSEYPELAIVIMDEKLQEETMHKAIFSGAKDVLIRPIVPARLVDSIYKANQHMKTKVLVHKESVPKTRRRASAGQVYTVFSTKGGVGRTFIAINLAVALAKTTGKRVVLVDLDLDFGNAALALNIVPKFTIADIVDDIRNIDQDFIESYLIPHESGIKVLPANAQPMMNEFINAGDIDVILKTLQNAFDYVVVDMPGGFSETVNPAFAVADKLLIVTTPEVASVRNVKAALITLGELNYPKSKIKVILNKVAKGDRIKLKDVETTLNQDVLAALRADYKEVISSLNLGIPFVIKNSSRPLTKDFVTLVKKLVDNTELKRRK